MKLIRTTGRNARAAAETMAALRNRGGAALDAVLPVVNRIVADVRKRGDRALLRYAAEFDGLSGPNALRVTREEMAAAWKGLDPALRDALRAAATQIRDFAQRQMPVSWSNSSFAGLTTGQLVRPLNSVGCYVPSGRHPLPSTLLMTAIPALVAGVRRIVVISPKPALETLAAAHLLAMPELCGMSGNARRPDWMKQPWIPEFYRLGGAHAVAALAYGTASILRVDKIVGPGNLYVTAAKRLVAFDCAIDMLAGPTEIVVTSERGNAADIASDLVAQAEHDPEALAILVTTRDDLAKAVIAETKVRRRENPVAREALARNGYVFLAGSYEEACDITNWLAPEHLTVDSAGDLDWITNAGSVFVGRWSAQPMGDYISGPNHTLPTGGMARVRGGLSVNDFVKLITVQEYSAKAICSLGPPAALLAEAEGLIGHAEAIRTRLGSDASGKRRARG
ncbi:MAG: histidinol dehydrogenase [Terracidiphilus sp.]